MFLFFVIEVFIGVIRERDILWGLKGGGEFRVFRVELVVGDLEVREVGGRVEEEKVGIGEKGLEGRDLKGEWKRMVIGG